MHDLEIADKIYQDMQREEPNFAKKLVMKWRELMPEQYSKAMYLARWGFHIASKDLYKQGLKYITDNKNEPVQPWSVDEIIDIAKNYINIDDEEYYDYDLAMMTNILKGDIYPIVKDPNKVVQIAIEFLSDEDYPMSEPSERAYRWVECHIEKEEKEKGFK